MSETPSITVHMTVVDAQFQATTRFLDNAGLGYSFCSMMWGSLLLMLQRD